MAKKKKVTLSIDSSVYDSFKEYCEENAIMLSKKIELFMKNEIGSADSENVDKNKNNADKRDNRNKDNNVNKKNNESKKNKKTKQEGYE